MHWTSTIWAAFLFALLASTVAAQSPGADHQDERREVKLTRLIQQLDADSYDAREAASRQLAEAGPEAAELIAAAANHPSPEVRFRAAAILESLRQMPLRDLEKQLVAFVNQPDDKLDVEQGMCLIARILDPQVRPQELVKKLDEMADKVRLQLGKEVEPARADPQKAVAALRQVLYVDYGFNGNQDDYDNPDNCSLASVLATRKGKPVLLGQIMIVVARRLKIPIVGVPVTGQYLVKYDGSRAPAGYPREDIYLHPFDSGRILNRQDLAREYPDHDPDRMPPPATNRETLARILRNIVLDLDEQDDAAAPYRRELSEKMLDLLQPDR